MSHVSGGSTADKPARRGPVDGIVKERKWPFFIPTTLWVVAAFFLSGLLLALIVRGLALAGVKFGSVDPNVLTTAEYAVTYLLIIVITLGVPRLLKRWSTRISFRKLLGLQLLRWRDILFAVLGFIIYLALGTGLVLLISSLIPGFNPTQSQDLGYSKILSPTNAIFVFIALVIVAPVAEEIIFRGYLFGTLRRTLPVWVAALITSAVFGAIHGQWNVGVDVFMMSLVSCFLRYKTGSLAPSILLHMMKNGLAFYSLYVATSGIL